jgi:hypothetical protein
LNPNAFAIHVGKAGIRRPAPVIDPAVRPATENQQPIGFVGALDGGPVVVRVGPPQIRQVMVDGVGVDIDEPSAGG